MTEQQTKPDDPFLFKRVQLEVQVNLLNHADVPALEDELCAEVTEVVREFVDRHQDVLNDTEGWGVG